jgi:uracil-DNA glycosylase
LNVTGVSEDPSLHADFVEWLRCVREYLVFQANCGTTGLPRSPATQPSITISMPSLTEPPASLKPPPPSLDSEFETRLPMKTPSQVPVRTAVACAALSEGERTEKLALLQQTIVGCTRCTLHERRTQTVFARGTAKSGICFVGEGPGADEDEQGLPFVGKAGQLLDRMIAAMALDRNDVYVCNIVKCRPPNNRKPQPDETEACRPYLEQQLDLLSPEVIVALGATAVEGLLGITDGITRMRGKWKLYRGQTPVMPTFHPAYLLRNPSAKHAVWDDMCEVLKHLGRPVPTRTKS